MRSESRNCQNCRQSFTIEPDDFDFYEKIGVPPPTWCPHCRFIRRCTFINERSLYKRTCGNCEKSIISMYSPESPILAWCIKCYLSDTWDARDYARKYDFSRSFFEQFKEMRVQVPHRSLDQNEINGFGCEYANHCFSSKNVYMSFGVGKSENIKYSTQVYKNNKNCVDSLMIKANDKGYELVHASQNYNSTFLVESDQCVESHFLYDCSNCVNCFMSSNLRNKSNVFRNKQLSRKEYQKALEELRLETYSGQENAKREFSNLAMASIHKFADIKNSVNAIGDFIENSKNVYQCFGITNSENVKYVYIAGNTIKDSQDLVGTGLVEECYEFTYGGRGANRAILSLSCGGGSKNLYYCTDCRGCSDCFGCVGLNKKQYCIFNTQYTKEEYFSTVEKIRRHMTEMPYVDARKNKYHFGEFFPTELSPFAYNETVAYEEQPLSKPEVINKGYKWRDMEQKYYSSTIKSDVLPDSIKEVADIICDDVIECSNQGKVENRCTSAFKILPDELTFYRQMKLPLPRLCPNCRYHQRLSWKNPFRFYKRGCMCSLLRHGHEEKCPNEFETMYSPERPEAIYCKECYQKEIY